MAKTVMSALVVLTAVLVTVQPARADRHGMFDRVVGGEPRAEPNGPQSAPGHGVRHGRRGGHGPSTSYVFFGVGPGFAWAPGFGIPSGGLDWSWGHIGPWGTYGYGPWLSGPTWYLPPRFTPAELHYGPLAAQRFMGAPAGVWAAPPMVDRPLEALPKELRAAEIAARLRTSNEPARLRARRWMELGDALFHQQRCHEALQRYKSAIQAAPDVTDAYIRQGFALIAVNQYKLAAKAFKISLHLDPGAWQAKFQLDDLYHDNRLAKTAHLELLAQSALDRPDDADLLFLIGMTLWADGERDRAREFLRRAHALAGPGADFLTPLLAPPAAEAMGVPEVEI